MLLLSCIFGVITLDENLNGLSYKTAVGFEINSLALALFLNTLNQSVKYSEDLLVLYFLGVSFSRNFYSPIAWRSYFPDFYQTFKRFIAQFQSKDDLTFQESRPLGAILVSGCTILEGCEAEDQQTGVGRNFSFRLIFEVKQPPRPTCPHKTAELEAYYGNAPRILCLAADSKEELTPWLNVIDHCAQIQENVSWRWYPQNLIANVLRLSDLVNLPMTTTAFKSFSILIPKQVTNHFCFMKYFISKFLSY